MNSDDMLAVYGAPFWHQDIMIAGTREALERLMIQISNTLAYGQPDSRCHMHVDGEGFDVIVRLLEPESMAKMPPHYQSTYEVWSTEQVARVKAAFCPEKNNG